MSAQLSSAGALRRRVFCACARTCKRRLNPPRGGARPVLLPRRRRPLAQRRPPRHHASPAPARPARRNEFDAAISETEGAYMKILESSQTLLSVLKRESTLLTKKKTGV